MQQKSQDFFMFLGPSLAPVDVDVLRFPTSVRHRVIPVSANRSMPRHCGQSLASGMLRRVLWGVNGHREW